MQWRNGADNWGVVSITLHWLLASALLGQFALGVWMSGLDYYHPWYHRAPFVHHGIGILLLCFILARLVWRLSGIVPAALPTHRSCEIRLARTTQLLLYLLPLLIIVSGYLTTTADGKPVSVFGWFDTPALPGTPFPDNEHLEELMGHLHTVLAWSLIGLVGLHTLGALKHHLFDHDNTLTRMLRTTKTKGAKS